MKVKIFGREPVAVVGLIEAMLVCGLSFGLPGLSQETVGLIMAAAMAGFGVYTAYVTKQTLLGGVVGLMKATLALAAVYGLSLTDAQTAALIAVTTMGFGLYHRTQTSPAVQPSFHEGPAPVTVVNNTAMSAASIEAAMRANSPESLD